MAESQLRRQTGGLGAFGTPTVVHLTGALVVSAIMSAPWRDTVMHIVTAGREPTEN